MRFLPVFSLLAVVSQSSAEYSSIQNVTYYPPSCAETIIRRTGVHVVHPQPGFGEPFQVYCDNQYDGGGWTVIQNRFNGSVFFFRGWKDYENGFGSFNGEHWLGLKKIHELTNANRHELVVLLEDRDGVVASARYDYFLLGAPETKYRLIHLGNYSGDAGDSLEYHLNQKFSTVDADNDQSSINCAEHHMGGWWYKTCYEDGSNLNGPYWDLVDGYGFNWYKFRGYSFLKSSRMMIRAVDFP